MSVDTSADNSIIAYADSHKSRQKRDFNPSYNKIIYIENRYTSYDTYHHVMCTVYCKK